MRSKVPGFKVLLNIALASCLYPLNAANANVAGEKAAAQLDVAYFHYPPFLIEGEVASGFIIDIEREIFERAGYQLNFKAFPYSRALLDTSKGKFDFCASLVPMAIEGLTYPKNEVAELKTVFVIKKNNPWRYQGIASLSGKVIGNIISYDYSSISKAYNDYLHSDDAQVTALSGDNVTARMLRMISKGRVETYSDSKSLLEYTMLQNDMAGQFEFTGTLGNVLLTKPGFPESAENSAELIKVFDRGMDRIRADGTLEKIMKKYGLSAWPSHKSSAKTL